MRIDDKFEMVRHAFESGRPSQAYLIAGPVRGVGMEMTLRILQYLFCEAADGRPCGLCGGCRRVREKTQVDITWIYPEKKSRIISVENIRENLLSVIGKSSMLGGWKAGVIFGADRLNTASSNAFLKTLEEPPPRTVFLLLSEAPQLLLPTVISRCQRLDLAEVRELEEPWRGRVLETLAFDLYRTPLERLAMSNNLCAILKDIMQHVETVVKEEQTHDKVDESKDVHEAKISSRYREYRGEFILTLLRWVRDLCVLCAGGADALVHHQEYLDVLRPRAAKLELTWAAYNIKAVEELSVHLNERNMPEESALAYAIDRIQHGV